MGEILKKRLLQQRFQGPHHEALLNLMLASAHVRSRVESAFADADLTASQYNVLRILNGAYPKGYARCEIARRMLERAPDLTRMIDRLIALGYVERRKCEEDARRSMAYITPRGRALLVKLHPLVSGEMDPLRENLTAAEARELSRLCEKVYGPAFENELQSEVDD